MSAFERRRTPRYSVSCLAELASGEAVAAARIGEVSDTGCRVLILDPADDLADRFGETGLLSIRPSGQDRAGVVVPVVLRHVQVDGGDLHYGLEFRPMSIRQAMRLAATVADLVAGRAPLAARFGDPAEASASFAGPARDGGDPSREALVCAGALSAVAAGDPAASPA